MEFLEEKVNLFPVVFVNTLSLQVVLNAMKWAIDSGDMVTMSNDCVERQRRHRCALSRTHNTLSRQEPRVLSRLHDIHSSALESGDKGISMARLYRFVKLRDHFDTHVFTFLIPSRILLHNCHEIFCKDLTYGFQRWTMSFMKSETHLSAYLKLRVAYTGVTVIVDYGLTLINRHHFTKNESYIDMNCKFTRDECTKGIKCFVCLSELAHRQFAQENGDFMIELELRNARTTFDCVLNLDKLSPNTTGDNNNRKFRKIESSYCSFGLDDWSLSLTPQGHVTDKEFKALLTLCRHTSFDHCSNVKYKVYLGADFAYESDILVHHFDISGSGPSYPVSSSIEEISKSLDTIAIRVEILSATSHSHVTIDAVTRGKNRGHFYDRDKQAWMIESNLDGEFLCFVLYYKDISHVPRKHTRLVNWNLAILDATSGNMTYALGGPFCKYYVQQDLDEGYTMRTNILAADVTRCDSPYLDSRDRRLSVNVDWIDSHLLVIPTYHRLDDAIRIQRHQMQRELLALQAENYALEKQVYSYQLSLSKKEARRHDSLAKNGDIRTPVNR